jgi:hypothetical protein
VGPTGHMQSIASSGQVQHVALNMWLWQEWLLPVAVAACSAKAWAAATRCWYQGRAGGALTQVGGRSVQVPALLAAARYVGSVLGVMHGSSMATLVSVGVWQITTGAVDVDTCLPQQCRVWEGFGPGI